MDKQNSTVVSLERIPKRFKASSKQKEAAALTDVADALRDLPPWAANDLLEGFMRDLRRAKAYWKETE